MTEYPSEYEICPNCGYEPGTPAESALHMQPGSILLNRYLIGRVIGYGGFGVTYIAWDNTLQQRVAIKEYLPSEFATRAVGQTQVTVFSGNKAEQFSHGMAKFIDEAKRLAQFQSEPGIVRVFDSFEANNTAYIVMEYLDGETLTSYLEREETVPVEKAIEMLTPVILSLEVVHKAGIIHRDIAPDNIMLTKDGQVKLIDFGAARYATTSHSRSLTVIIKPGYSPEEQYRSRGDQGPHTDVYALAAVLYRMITGITPPDALERRAFLENKKKDILVSISKNCKIEKNQETAILNAMNVRVEDRTKTADDFLRELTSAAPVKRLADRIKAIDLMKWPLWAKIVIPVGAAAVIVLFVLLFTGTIGFENHLIMNFTLGTDMTRVPSVINYSVGIAEEMLDEHELASLISGREVSEEIPVNMVLRQGTDAGGIVEKGSTIELYISAASDPVVEEGTMPDVAYYTQADATDMLTELGADVTVEMEYSSDIAEGIVIRTSIGYGDPLHEGDSVILYVSKGPDPTVNAVDLTLNRSSLSLFVGDKTSLTASGGNGSYQWNSSNSSVVSVKNGTVTALKKGSATITVSNLGKTKTCSVTVEDYSPAFASTSLSISSGKSKTLSLLGAPANVHISWSSSNPAVASVNSSGEVTAAGHGNTRITASFSYYSKTYTASCNVSVAKEWSDWSETPAPSGAETRKQILFRYRDFRRDTTESTSPSLSGWTLYDTRRETGEWSSWSDTPAYGSNTREVQTQTVQVTAPHMEYRYGDWRSDNGYSNWCPDYGYSLHGGSWHEVYTSWSETRKPDTGHNAYCADPNHNHTHISGYDSNGWANWNIYCTDGVFSGWDGKAYYFWEESRWVNGTTKTQYRYRDIRTVYSYYRNIYGSWSEWSSQNYEETDTREVQQKVLYQYVLN